jgi:hypothetical protein
MSRRWRWSFVVLIAATVLGGFMPRALLADATAPVSRAFTVMEEAPMAPSGCLDATCGKGAPAPATPSLTVVAVAAATAVAAALIALSWHRRRRSLVYALLPGSPSTLLRPPQFS